MDISGGLSFMTLGQSILHASRSWYQQHQPGTTPCCSYSLFEAHPFWTSDSASAEADDLDSTPTVVWCPSSLSMEPFNEVGNAKRTDFLLWLICTGRDASFWPRFQRIYVDVHGTCVHRRSHICLAELSGHVREAIVWTH